MQLLESLRAANTDHSELHRRIAPLRALQVRDSGLEADAYTIKGHAAVFNRPCDFRAFKEYIAPGAFKAALSVKPLEVVSNWEHDNRWMLGHTLSKTLDLMEDEDGLMQWTRVAPTSFADDLRILLDRGDIQQQSFCFIIGAETWEYLNEGEDDEEIRVTITEVKELFDVTVCALGAYPQTDVTIAGRERLGAALRAGRVPGLTYESALQRGIVTETERRSGPRPTTRAKAPTREASTPSAADRVAADRLAIARARAANSVRRST